MRLALTALLILLGPAARGDDWPQWFGPNRDGVWREIGLLAGFPKGGPAIKWRTPIHAGYSGPAVAGGKVFLTDFELKPDVARPKNPFQRLSQPGTERVICLDEATGHILWTHSYDADYTVSYSAGPRATPAVDGDRVYSLVAEGDLCCLNIADGKPLWSKRLSGEQSPTPIWGFAGHPLIDGDKVICLTSGNNPAGGHGVVTAFNKMTGVMLWTALAAQDPGYAPPMLIRAGGTRQLIVWDTVALSSLDPETGKTYWSEPFGPVRSGVSILTPRFAHDQEFGDVLMVSTQYEGTLIMKLDVDAPKATVFWKRAGKSDKKTEALHSLICSPVIRDGHIFGIDAMGELRCLDLRNGDRLWSTNEATTYKAGPTKWATAFLIPIGETGSRFLIANEHGDLILADMDSKGYREAGRCHVLEPLNMDAGRPVVWSFPALADRCVFWRNDKEIICVEMAAK